MADVVPVKDGNTAATLEDLQKHMDLLRCPSWREAPMNPDHLRIWLYTSDRGRDQVGLQKVIAEEVAGLANVLFINSDCVDHQLHCIIMDKLRCAYGLLKTPGKPCKHSGSFTKVAQLWRDNAQTVKDTWESVFDAQSEKQLCGTLCPMRIDPDDS